jgi:hypothetical protein
MTSLDYLEYRPRQRVRQLYISDDKPSIRQLKLRKAFPSHPNKRPALNFATLDSFVGSASMEAIEHARAILYKLESENIEPIKVTPAAEGGVAICFANREKYSDIECLNSGEILGVISNRRDHPIVWEIEPNADGVARAITRIREFLASPT